MPLSAGDKLGPYEIIAPVGAGGMGEVYRRVTRGWAAPWRSRSQPHSSPSFEREAHAVAALNHPHICRLYEIWSELPGHGVHRRRTPRAPLPIDEVVKYATHIADALDAAHAKGIIHRDIKPANVMITARGEAKVLDFGLVQFNAQTKDGGSET
jgi:serine/threonine protein kinase